MNIALWILQILLAAHTVIGALWKFSNPAQAVPELTNIPGGVWMTMSVIELFCAVGLILPVFRKSDTSAPIAAAIIGAEMLGLCVMAGVSGTAQLPHLIYWLVVAAVCAFIVYGRLATKPSAKTA